MPSDVPAPIATQEGLGRALKTSNAALLHSQTDAAKGGKRSRAEVAGSIFVWAILGLMLLSLSGFVGFFGRNIPWWDDWEMVPALTGNEPSIPSWLWKPYDEHRLVLPKLTLLGLARITGNDFRAGMWFNVLGLGALAAAMVVVARKVRGRTSPADAFFPLILLNWGHWANLLWSWQVQFILSTALAGILLMIVVCKGSTLRWPTALLAGLCLMLLPLCGANGLPFVPPLALWLGVLGVRRWRSAHPADRSLGLAMIGLAVAPLVILGLYLMNFPKGIGEHATPHLGTALKSMVKFLAMSFGSAAVRGWPYAVYLLLVLLLASGLGLLLWWRQNPREWPRAAGLLLFLAGVLGLAFGVAWGRVAWWGPERLFSRHYVTPAVPVLYWIYFVGLIAGMRWGRWLTWALFAAAVPVCLLGDLEGLRAGEYRRAMFQKVERDLAAGLPPFMIAERHVSILLPYEYRYKGYLADCVRMLNEAGIAPFAALTPNPDFAEVPLPVEPASTSRLTWDPKRHTATQLGDQPALTFTWDKPRFCYAVRVQLVYVSSSVELPAMQMLWEGSQTAAGAGAGRHAGLPLYTEPIPRAWANLPPSNRKPRVDPTPRKKVVTIWVHDTIDHFRLELDGRRCRSVGVEGVTLLVPKSAGT